MCLTRHYVMTDCKSSCSSGRRFPAELPYGLPAILAHAIPWPVATDSDVTDKGLVAYRLGFWAERRTALQRVDACQQSERYNKVCDPRSSWFVTLSYRRRAVERSGSTGPTTLSQLALRVNNFEHFQTF